MGAGLPSGQWRAVGGGEGQLDDAVGRGTPPGDRDGVDLGAGASGPGGASPAGGLGGGLGRGLGGGLGDALAGRLPALAARPTGGPDDRPLPDRQRLSAHLVDQLAVHDR